MNKLIKTLPKIHPTQVLRSWQELIDFACHMQASDLHLAARLDHYHIQYRLQGTLCDLGTIHKQQSTRMIRQIKLFSGCDTTDTHHPQDGRFDWHNGYECRVNICPCILGERVVIRLHPPGSQLLKINQLGLPHQGLKKIKQWLHKKQGLLLISGPTGSGKTTTLYAMIAELAQQSRSIITIEDPVEMRLPYINQTQINDPKKLTPNKLLHAILRQDPDVIMIGEIRDQAMLKTAINAADTGHLVLATVHSNNALETFIRLDHLGIKPQHYIHSLSMVIAQRLVPCIRKKANACKHTLISKQIALFQICCLNKTLIHQLNQGFTHQHIKKLAPKLGITSFYQQAYQLHQQGLLDKQTLAAYQER
jgi:type IV pilus assembly protein PilB